MTLPTRTLGCTGIELATLGFGSTSAPAAATPCRCARDAAIPAVATVIPGARDVAEIEENPRLMALPVPDALWPELRQASLVR